MLWLAGLVALGLRHEGIPLGTKVVAIAVLAIGAPSVSVLLQSYKKYREVWQRDNSADKEDQSPRSAA